jgi:TetR/AcrR family transcriptional regulator
MKHIYHTPVFENISEEKRKAVLEAASAEFAELGYNAANINIIARKAGVSIGSLYKYFSTKENLFLAVAGHSVSFLSGILDAILDRKEADFFDRVEQIIRMIQKHAREQSVLVNLYNEITTEGNRELVSRLSYQMESVSASCYEKLITQGKADGSLPLDIDSAIFSFHLDNLFIALQFSYASEYYRERMKIFLGQELADDDESIVSATMQFIRRAFSRA